MSETCVWAIGIKADRTGGELKAAVNNSATAYLFRVPTQNLRIGTLDSLMSLSDDLGKMDTLAEASVTKMYKQLVELNPNDDPSISGVPVLSYTTMQWEWDEAKFQMNTPLRELCEFISARVASLDEELKIKVGEVNALKGSLQAMERKTQGNLMVRALDDLVAEDDVMESEYMTTVFPVVSKGQMKEFESYYEKMAKYVVPRSGMLLSEDLEYALCVRRPLFLDGCRRGPTL